LPEGATIDDQSKDVIFADINGDGQKEEIIFYSVNKSLNDRKAGVLILKSNGADYVRFWERIYDDSSGFAYPTGVYDLNKSGKPQIVAYRTIGASCPGILDVFEYRKGTIQQITGPWAQNGQCQSVEVKDLNGGGRTELIVKTRNNGTRTDVYLWDGRQYVERNSLFTRYYNDELSQLLQDIHSGKALPISARITWCKQAVRVYLLQRRYAEAFQLSQAVLVMIDDPNLTRSNTIPVEGGPPNQQERISAWFEIEKSDAKVVIHRLLADTFQASGDSHRAQKENEEARTLESVAKEERVRLPT